MYKLIVILLLLFIVIYLFCQADIPIKLYPGPSSDKHMKGLNVLKAKFSHSRYPDNNIPGILPGPIPGDMLGLEDNDVLNLREPIHAPIVDLPKEMLDRHKYRKVTCCPFNGSYCQCTNNYLPIK